VPEADDDAMRAEAELAELRALGARIGSGPVEWDEPPADLWSRISAAVGEPADSEGLAAEPGPAGIVPLRSSHHARRSWLLASAAAVVVVVGTVVGLVALSGGDDADVVAATALERLGEQGSGNAELLDDDGRLELRVDTSDLDPGDGFLELWMIDPTVTRLVSLGPLRPDGVYELPPGLDPGEFPVVDVSIEPLDGNPAHSGDSVLRGQLPV
jgi:anti-sigma-K factor RskA